MASKSRDESNSLKRFAECAVAMRNILQQDGEVGEAEFAFMDNHFQVLEMAYFRWKQKQTHPSSCHRRRKRSVKDRMKSVRRTRFRHRKVSTDERG